MTRTRPDHPFYIKETIKQFSCVYVVLFNALLKLSYFPTAWKKSKIIMIKKPGKDKTLTLKTTGP